MDSQKCESRITGKHDLSERQGSNQDSNESKLLHVCSNTSVFCQHQLDNKLDVFYSLKNGCHTVINLLPHTHFGTSPKVFSLDDMIHLRLLCYNSKVSVFSHSSDLSFVAPHSFFHADRRTGGGRRLIVPLCKDTLRQIWEAKMVEQQLATFEKLSVCT